MSSFLRLPTTPHQLNQKNPYSMRSLHRLDHLLYEGYLIFRQTILGI